MRRVDIKLKRGICKLFLKYRLYLFSKKASNRSENIITVSTPHTDSDEYINHGFCPGRKKEKDPTSKPTQIAISCALSETKTVFLIDIPVLELMYAERPKITITFPGIYFANTDKPEDAMLT